MIEGCEYLYKVQYVMSVHANYNKIYMYIFAQNQISELSKSYLKVNSYPDRVPCPHNHKTLHLVVCEPWSHFIKNNKISFRPKQDEQKLKAVGIKIVAFC